MLPDITTCNDMTIIFIVISAFSLVGLFSFILVIVAYHAYVLSLKTRLKECEQQIEDFCNIEKFKLNDYDNYN